MKHPKPRLTAREWAATAFLIAGLLALACSGDKPYIWIPALLIGLTCWAMAAVILNWPEIKEYMKGADTYGQASNIHQKSDKIS